MIIYRKSVKKYPFQPVQQPVKPFAGRFRHHRAIHIVDLVVTHPPAVVQLVEKILEIRNMTAGLVRVPPLRIGLIILFPIFR